jgi:bifunctional DNA-binding transcriptional regulator/antitoxin component of YhaV-PrlF toxin-antitoxin module
MVIAYSKLTEQGLVLIPDEVLQKLGIGPGAVLEWGEDGEKIVVRPVRSYTSEDVHRALFPEPPKARTLKEMKEGIKQHIKERYARD